MRRVVLASGLVLNSSPSLPATNTQTPYTHTHKTSVPLTAARLLSWGETFPIDQQLIRRVYSYSLQDPVKATIKAPVGLVGGWRVDWFHIRVITAISAVSANKKKQKPPNVTRGRKWSALSKHNVTAPQIYPIPMSWLHIVPSPGGFERVTFHVDGLFLPTTHTHMYTHHPPAAFTTATTQ